MPGWRFCPPHSILKAMIRYQLALLSLLSTQALAQAPVAVVSPQPAAAVAQQTAPGAPVSAPGINPFTGKALTIEDQLRQLELLKLQTSMLEEQLRQTNLREDTLNVPARKNVERNQAATSVLKEQVAQKELRAAVAGRTGSAPAEASDAPKPKATKKAVKAAEPSKPVVVVPAPKPMPSVSSVMSMGGTKTAVLTSNEGSLVVRIGDSTPWGKVSAVTDNSVTVDGKVLKVHNMTLARVTLSDVAAVQALPANTGNIAAQAGGISPASYRSQTMPVGMRDLPPPPIPSGR